MFHAERGGGAFLNGEPLPIRTSMCRIRNATANGISSGWVRSSQPRSPRRRTCPSATTAQARWNGATSLQDVSILPARGQKLWTTPPGPYPRKGAGHLT
jgi:fructose-1,6-bisphosphatase/inositol monophosphatase family enzyme